MHELFSFLIQARHNTRVPYRYNLVVFPVEVSIAIRVFCATFVVHAGSKFEYSRHCSLLAVRAIRRVKVLYRNLIMTSSVYNIFLILYPDIEVIGSNSDNFGFSFV